MSEATFPYGVFLSHSAKDKAVGRPLAERLREGGLDRSLMLPRAHRMGDGMHGGLAGKEGAAQSI